MKLYKIFKLKQLNMFWILLLSLSLAACSSQSSPTSTPTNEAPAQKEEVAKPKEEEKAPTTYPEKDIEFIIPFGAGGGTDQVGRMLAQLVQEKTGKNVLAVNKPGGGGAIGFTELANAKPDGYKIGLVTSNIVTNKIMGISDINYEKLDSVILVNFDSPGLFVSKDAPWKTADEFIKHAQQNKVVIATGSPGGLWHIGTLQLQKLAGLQFNIVAGAQGGNGAAAQLLGGHVDAIIVPPNEATQVQTGDFRMLGTMTQERLAKFPDVPTFKELGYDINIASYRAIVVPKGTPQAIEDQLHTLFKEAIENEKYVKLMDEQLSNVIYKDPIGTLNLWKEEEKMYSEMIPKLNLK